MLKIKIVGVFIFVCFGIWLGLKFKEINNLKNNLNEQLMQANLEIGKAHTQFGDAKDKISLLEKQLQNEINAHDEIVFKYGKLLAKYNTSGGGNGSSANTSGPIIVVKPEFTPGKLYVAQAEDLLQPYNLPFEFNFSDSRINISTTLLTNFSDKIPYNLSSDFKYDLHLKIMAQLVETISESGAVNNYAQLFEIDDNGNKLGKFELSSFEVVVNDNRKMKFHIWNPKLDIGASIGYAGDIIVGGNLGISAMSYGLTENDLTWRFARVGVILSKDNFGFDFSPVLWNIGDPLPIVQNLWIGPSIIFNAKSGAFGLLTTISVLM